MGGRLTEWEEIQDYTSKGFAFVIWDDIVDVSLGLTGEGVYTGKDILEAFAACELYLQSGED